MMVCLRERATSPTSMANRSGKEGTGGQSEFEDTGLDEFPGLEKIPTSDARAELVSVQSVQHRPDFLSEPGVSVEVTDDVPARGRGIAGEDAPGIKDRAPCR